MDGKPCCTKSHSVVREQVSSRWRKFSDSTGIPTKQVANFECQGGSYHEYDWRWLYLMIHSFFATPGKAMTNILPVHPDFVSSKKTLCKCHFFRFKNIWRNKKTSWWFQPNWKIWVKLDHFPKNRGENKKPLKPPPRKNTKAVKCSNSNRKCSNANRASSSLTSIHCALVFGTWAKISFKHQSQSPHDKYRLSCPPMWCFMVVVQPILGISPMGLYMFVLVLPPGPQDASGKWRFRLGSPSLKTE